MNATRVKFNLFLVLLISGIFPIVSWIILDVLFAERSYVQIPFHSLFESLGAFAALSLAVFILLLRKFEKDTTTRVWISCGLIGMGILDGFHAAVSPGTSFVWLHSIATLAGGFFFLWALLPERTPKGNWANILTGGITVVAVLVGVFSIAFSHLLPAMIDQNYFTQSSKAINIIGGLFFLAATLRLMHRYWLYSSAEDFLFANLSLLFCVSNLLFQFSQPWHINWWFWHLLRLIAYLIALSYIFITFRNAQTFKVSNELLEQHNEVLRGLMRETQEAVNVLASSTTEIMTSTRQLATSSTETSVSVTETTTTVEEAKQAVQMSNEKSKEVSEAARKAAQVSLTGKQASENAIEGINRIRGQMDLIAESIVGLSEQSQTIGEITSSVEDLANQSNLLAVNASIEAAKAGEQGKGFAVVAQEVKSLAVQSKQATAQVRTILNDVQKAIGKVVMAIEQGSNAVKEGVGLANVAGEAIKKLGETVMGTAQAASQIAVSSQQQMIGMDQIATAMENIKQATNQNVAGTKQMEVSAQNLHELGQKLSDLVKRYKV